MEPSARRYFAGVVIAFLLLASATRSQTPGTGAISGVVHDPTSRLVANAEVLAINNAPHISRSATTTSDGMFRLALLPPGMYAVSVKAPGYEIHTSSSVQVPVSEINSLPITLVVEGASATIQVNSGPQVADLDNATLGGLVDETAIKALPLSNRNYTQILGLSPGGIVDLPNAAQLGRGTQNVAPNGATPTANNIQFKGIDANNLAENSAANSNEQVGTAIPTRHSIQEFRVQTANFNASYGRGTGATSGAGSRSARFGYKPVLLGIAGLALVAEALFRILIPPHRPATSAAIAIACLQDGNR